METAVESVVRGASRDTLCATGQLQMELEPLNVITLRGHLQCERAALDWGIVILKRRKLK